MCCRGTTLFATGKNAVFVIDTNSNTVVDTINVPGVLDIPTLTPDGAFLYAPVSAGNSVVLINTKTKNVVGPPIAVESAPLQVAAAANDIYGYSSNLADGTVTVFNLAHLPPGSP